MKSILTLAILLASLMAFGCKPREITVETFTLKMPADTNERLLYAAHLFDAIAETYDLDALEKVTLSVVSPFQGETRKEVPLDEFLSSENRKMVVESAIKSALKSLSNGEPNDGSFTNIAFSALEATTNNDEATIVALIGRFSQCYSDTTNLIRKIASLPQSEYRGKLYWSIPGSRSVDVKVRGLLEKRVELVNKQVTAADYDECTSTLLSNGDNTQSSLSGSVLVASFVSSHNQALSAAIRITRLAQGREIVLVVDGAEPQSILSSNVSADSLQHWLAEKLLSGLGPRWNSINYVLKATYAAAAVRKNAGDGNLIVVVGELPTIPESEAKRLPKGGILDTVDWNSLPKGTAVSFMSVESKPSEMTRLLKNAFKIKGITIAETSEKTMK